MTTTTIKMDIGSGIIRSYKRLGYRAWYALAEFIDNSTQNYFSNRAALDKAGDTPPLDIQISYDRDHLRIFDNAMGMNEAELRQALQIGIPPADTTGRSEYGLGMKTAACWFGDKWTVTTKKLGESFEYEATIDVESVASGNTDIPTVVRPKDPKEHYTIIDIMKLHRKLSHLSTARLETYIKSMYRVDLRNADLYITINSDEPIQADDGNVFLEVANQQYKREFSTMINGKTVTGWIGILNPGARSKAGLAIVRRGRVIKGQPDAWRPEKVFGYDAPNDLRNQRLVGEIHLDQFAISHTKDEILWEDEEEIQIQDYLSSEFAAYIEISQARKGGTKSTGGPSQAEIALGVSELREHMMSAAFVDALQLQEVPPDEVVTASNKHLIESSKSDAPILSFSVGKVPVQLFLNSKASPNDPYFSSDFPSDQVLVSVNTQHIHFTRIAGGPAGVRNYLMECMYDALAEWKAMRAANLKHDTIKYLKNGLLLQDISESAPRTNSVQPPQAPPTSPP